MKKYTIAFAVSVFSLAATFIALGIYIHSLHVVDLFIDSLKGSGFAGLIIVILLYLPLLFISVVPYFLIGLAIIYLLSGAAVVWTACDKNYPRLYKRFRIYFFSNGCFLALIAFIDIITIDVFCRSASINVSVPFIIFMVLFNVTLIGIQTSVGLGANKLRNMLYR